MICASVPVTDMVCVPDPASLVPPDVIAMLPLAALTFSTRLPGLPAAKASVTETPVIAVAEPVVTLSLAGTAIAGPARRGGGARSRADVEVDAVTVTPVVLVPSMPA